MTEAEWLAATDPTPMLEFIRGKASDRKLRLFAVACCWNVWHRLGGELSQKAVEVAERFADGWVSASERHVAHQWKSEVARHVLETDPRTASDRTRLFCVKAAGDTGRSGWEGSMPDPLGDMYRELENESQCDLLRDIFGPLPFRLVSADHPWLTETVVALATGIYIERAFDRMPILADALEDTGCDNHDILNHLRGDGPHVKGCWALDLVLGKS